MSVDAYNTVEHKPKEVGQPEFYKILQHKNTTSYIRWPLIHERIVHFGITIIHTLAKIVDPCLWPSSSTKASEVPAHLCIFSCTSCGDDAADAEILRRVAVLKWYLLTEEENYRILYAVYK